jgi:hypothetical protein
MSIARHRTLFASLTLLPAMAVAVLPAGPAFAATWTVVSTPNASAGLNLFSGVDAVSITDVWAVGRADHSPDQPFQRPLTARWSGGAWQRVTNPALAGQLSGVDGSSATNVWAVGVREVPLGGGTVTSGVLTERWNGSSWRVVNSPAPPSSIGSALSGVKTFSATNAWAVGSFSTSAQPSTRTLIQRWNGSSWSVVPSPNPDPTTNLLSDIDGASAGDLWAIGNMGFDGYGGTVAGLVLRRNGETWSRVNVPGSESDATFSVPRLQDVVAIAANDVWIVGSAFHRTLFKMVPYALHWNGLSWQRSFMANGPNDGQGFHSVAALSPTKVYAVGSAIARWTGSGWAQESATVSGVIEDAAATGTSTIWGAGYRYDTNLAQIRTLAMRTTNG